MIAGVCVKDGAIQQIYKRSTTHCDRCGSKLRKLEISQDPSGKLSATFLND